MPQHRIGQINKGRAKNRLTTFNARTFTYLCKLLHTQKLSRLSAAEKVGISPVTSAKYLRILKEYKLIYIVEYKRSITTKVGQFVAYYSWGFMETDAIKPPRKSQAENCKNYRARKRKENEQRARNKHHG